MTERAVWSVLADGQVIDTFASHEDAGGLADAANYAYPPEKGYVEFVVACRHGRSDCCPECCGECRYDA